MSRYTVLCRLFHESIHRIRVLGQSAPDKIPRSRFVSPLLWPVPECLQICRYLSSKQGTSRLRYLSWSRLIQNAAVAHYFFAK